MRAPRLLWLPGAVVLALAGCRDATGPADLSNASTYDVYSSSASADVHYLRQSPNAPALETYEVSFWARYGAASAITVRYQAAAGESVGQPFLRFEIPRNGLATDATGNRFRRGDSVLVTLTIDPVEFSVEFQPSGLQFSRRHPARLTIWYQNANPDLNGDGVVDAVDAECEEQIALWGHAPSARWVRLQTDADRTLPSVSAVLLHFSEYAVSW